MFNKQYFVNGDSAGGAYSTAVWVSVMYLSQRDSLRWIWFACRWEHNDAAQPVVLTAVLRIALLLLLLLLPATSYLAAPLSPRPQPSLAAALCRTRALTFSWLSPSGV